MWTASIYKWEGDEVAAAAQTVCGLTFMEPCKVQTKARDSTGRVGLTAEAAEPAASTGFYA